MIRRQGNKYRRNPLNVNISPIPEGLDNKVTEYLTGVQKTTGVGLKVKNAKGNDIPLRYKDGVLQAFEKNEWKDIKTKETVEITNNVTAKEEGVVSSGGSSGSIRNANNYKYINDVIERYISKHPLYTAGNFVNISNNRVITTTYSAGNNITISNTGEISSTGGGASYTAGEGIDITGNVISSTVVGVPNYSSSDEGKVLKIVGGVPVWSSSGGGSVSTGWLRRGLGVSTSNWDVDEGVATTDSSQNAINIWDMSGNRVRVSFAASNETQEFIYSTTNSNEINKIINELSGRKYFGVSMDGIGSMEVTAGTYVSESYWHYVSGDELMIKYVVWKQYSGKISVSIYLCMLR